MTSRVDQGFSTNQMMPLENIDQLVNYGQLSSLSLVALQQKRSEHGIGLRPCSNHENAIFSGICVDDTILKYN